MPIEKMPSGINANPLEGYNLASRFVCVKCWEEPKIKNPQKVIKDGGTVTVTLMCHGKEETKMCSLSDLMKTQRVFEADVTVIE